MGLSISYFPENVISFLADEYNSLRNSSDANDFLQSYCGIRTFFENDAELTATRMIIQDHLDSDNIVNRREFGDYQTNERLANESTKLVVGDSDYEFLLEPTCGKGNFIIAGLKNINSLKTVVGIEIHKPYVWETKLKVLSYYLNNPQRDIIDIDIINGDFFDYDFQQLADSTSKMKTLLIGNPPWITNSELGKLNSKNIPVKLNKKQLRGLDALTGKSNFDLGEAVLLLLFDHFQNHSGRFGLLVKNIVVKNILKSQKVNKYKLSNLSKFVINAKTEFDVSVNACLFFGNLGETSVTSCDEYDFYTRKKASTFGWSHNKFVSSITDYEKNRKIDGKSSLVWRSGMKHDCTKVMELDLIDGDMFINKLDDSIVIEPDLVYRILKSSDLKTSDITSSRKFTIVTQKKIGQDTGYIKYNYPLTYKYLFSKKDFFRSRKSSIYKGKPDYSIFGIGEYSFKLHKVAISGLYKKTQFTYVGPDGSKPIMLDDTCYSIGFNTKGQAKIIQALLNSQEVQEFLKSIIFSDSKRSINKDVLMRVNLSAVFNQYSPSEILLFHESITLDDYENLKEKLISNSKFQATLF